ncbi:MULTISPECIES: CaiB/BaiF CoA-transferase family protein [unclassified Acidisoma]|uniref:CaiB/BaiF CoA transferase family protein n=1 Tax=unclassified Acidisoma TaxID=2634065 RepID=UPI0020B145A0|nr:MULTISPECIES: CoA transferase [unclassified Acidisoma]
MNTTETGSADGLLKAAAGLLGGSGSGRQALEGIRVLDIATFVAAPFCGTILGDFGAEVIKIEQPNEGDSLRRFGTPTDCGDTLVWLSESRNKKTVTLNLKTAEGAQIFRDLVAKSDVVLENFRPGTLEKWGVGFEALREINPSLVMLRVSAYGQTGPKKNEPGFARIAHAFGGLTALAGEADGPPVVPGSTSLADYISGMWGAIGVLLALRDVQNGGPGQFIDVGLYESVFRLLDELVPAYAKFGTIRERMGPDTINVVPHSHYRTADGHWVAVACTNDRMFARLADVMGRGELAASPFYATTVARVERRAEVNAIVADWIGLLSQAEVLDQCQKGGVPCGPVYSIADIFEDPQYRARRNFFETEDPRIGPVTLPSPVPRLSETPAVFRHTGRALGADTAEILSDLLGIDEDNLSRLRAVGAI